MYQILLPVDESEKRAHRQASYVAALPGATDEVEAIVLFDEETGYQGAKPLEFAAVESAVLAVDELEAAGVACEGRLEKGMVAKTTIEVADEYDVGTIVMGDRKRCGVSKVLLGSVTQDVVLSVDRPVTVVG